MARQACSNKFTQDIWERAISLTSKISVEGLVQVFFKILYRISGIPPTIRPMNRKYLIPVMYFLRSQSCVLLQSYLYAFVEALYAYEKQKYE